MLKTNACRIFILAFFSSFTGILAAQRNSCSVNKDSLIAFSCTHIGTKYKYASYDPARGFDCSGFVYYVFKRFGISVPRSSSEYARFGRTIHPDSCLPGDVIVFTGPKTGKAPGHVGIVVSGSGDSLKFIHSSSDKKHGGIKISDFGASPNYKKRFIKIVRVANLISM